MRALTPTLKAVPVDRPPAGGKDQIDRTVLVANVTLVADPAGALYWPDERLLAVADLHLEKGSAFASRGVLLPPYDTASTLARLGCLIERYGPHLVIALGDSFHDRGGFARMHDDDRLVLRTLQRSRDWVWIAGNHDPKPVGNIDGRFAASLAIGPLTFRHQPSVASSDGEIAGHLHPLARIVRRGRAIRRRCFAGDGRRLVMPAFGAFAGGLNVRDRAITALFSLPDFTAHLLGKHRLYAVTAACCLPD